MDKHTIHVAAQWAGIVIAIVVAVFAALGAEVQIPTEEPVTDIEAAGVRYGQYGNAAFHGSIIVDNDATVTDDLTVTDDATLTTGDLTITAGDLTITAGDQTITAGDLAVTAGDIDVAAGDLTLASNNYPVEHGSSGREIYFAVTSAFTGTTSILSTTHGIATVTAVLCAIDDPDDDANDSFLCIGSATDGDVTITALATTGNTATEADTTAYYIILGN